MRKSTIGLLAAMLFVPADSFAQDGGSFGIGPRLTFVRGSSDSAEGSQRFTGGVIRMGGGRAAIELAMDYRSEATGDLTERVKSFPIQASLLLYPVRARVAPYVLAGVGWYTQRVTQFSAPTGTIVASEETTRRRGYHAGLGAEVRVHRRFGLYGDYRYTKLRFNDDDESSETPGLIPFAERLKLSHEGTMFTWGAAFYF
jgi:opacity protein-like surface antigen